ncbi:o-succinylbenzoate synthase [Lutimonas halocynthiae]|uniref:o-succinylbenzoate synthase n=1 Tax=Lutimonas halocynthiae TaxID=1446477 RepID=UPI0025B49A17|nr:o-succinylbenzoate synthase [Lutimonas halocynthiae]MDN3643624.1 o-succinylbenzoate synthase [Lutimonas halocynthiae]
MKASFHKYLLDFKRPGGTSRGVLHQKETYFLSIRAAAKTGVGECGLFRGLSYDDRPDYEDKLQWLCDNINADQESLFQELKEFPSIQFGLEQALLSLASQDKYELFPSNFSKGLDCIPINGLIWMGAESFMNEQISNKLKEGFTTLKMKIGAIDFQTELEILKGIRNQYDPSELELRVDVNGAFSMENALEKLEKLAVFGIHSIEQPIKAGQIEAMRELCSSSPIPIALDEELIGVLEKEQKRALLVSINPQYIILKPSLVGGFKGSREWIEMAEALGIGWWITSALESNIGLNAIAQFTYTLKNELPQGLGTGALFSNNIEAPLFVSAGELGYDSTHNWGDLKQFLNE